ncbi:MAG: hypothetical protein PHC75_08820 [Burkholderiales bacterium]|nr:hypothetical protein [Burkholderiales bacterium]
MRRYVLVFYLLIIGLFINGCVTKTISNDGIAVNKSDNSRKLSDTYTDLASEYLNHDAFHLALDRVNLAISINANNYRAYMVRGMIYQYLNKPNEANIDFITSLKLNSSYPDTYVNYGNFLCSIHNYEKAFTNFERAIDNSEYLSPEIAYYNRGKCYFLQGSFESANRDLLKSISYKHVPNNSYILLAELNYKQKKYTLAKFYIEQYPGDQSAASLWIHILILDALIDNSNNPANNRKYSSYINLLAQILLNDFKNSSEAEQYIMLYGNVMPNENPSYDTKNH